MRFYTRQHPFYCGIDLHARTMYLCILNQAGEIVLHKNMKCDPKSFLDAVAPYRPDLVVGVECIFTWYWMADLCAAEGISFVLGHAKHLWLYREENIPEPKRPLFESLRSLHLKVGKAWAIGDSLRCLWTYLREGMARRFFKRWFWWATHSRLQPVARVAHMIRRHLDNVVTYCQHPITNGVAEGLNSKIMTIKRRACGFRNKHHFKTAVYFYCGGLKLYPR